MQQHSYQLFVPLRVVPQSAEFLSPTIIQAEESTGSFEIGDFLAEMTDSPAFRRIALVGPTGSGKSTLLEHLRQTYAIEDQYRLPSPSSKKEKPIPILLYLRDLHQAIISDRPPTLSEVIFCQPFIYSRFSSPRWIERQLEQQQYLVMLDGLDDIGEKSDRQKMLSWIDSQLQDYPQVSFIVTSRPHTYAKAPLEKIKIVLEIQPFNSRQVRQFVRNWYRQDGEIELTHNVRSLPRCAVRNVLQAVYKFSMGNSWESWENSCAISRTVKETASVVNSEGINSVSARKSLLDAIESRASLGVMATNPFLLEAIATVYDTRGTLPSRRVELYDAICDILLGSQVAKKSQLQAIALRLMQQKTCQFAAKSLGNLTSGKFSGEYCETNLVQEVGRLIVEREEGIYEFFRKDFQEYLAALEVKRTKQENILINNIEEPWWQDTIRFYVAASEANQDIIRAALARPYTLKLAYDCLEEGLNIRPQLQKELELPIEAYLESYNSEIFRGAARLKLQTRLKRLLATNRAVALDNSYITCVEYQLFIDEKRKVGQYRQPDFWRDARFRPGTSTEAIAGIRASDAEEFCEWLTRQFAGFGVRYRLPSRAETLAFPLANWQLGSWCYGQKKNMVVAIAPELEQTWEENIAIALSLDLERARIRDGNFLTSNLAVTLAKARYRQIASNIVRALTHINSQGLLGNFERARQSIWALTRSGNLTRIRDLALRLTKARRRLKNRTLASDSTFDWVDTRTNLLLIYLFWDLLANTYRKKAEAQQSQRQSGDDNKNYDRLSANSAERRDDILNLYAFFLLMDERRLGRLPAWEGIRLALQRV